MENTVSGNELAYKPAPADDSDNVPLSTSRSPRFWRWFSLITGLASIVSLLLWFLPDKKREIVYAVSASPTSIVKAGQTSDLRVFFRDAPVNADVSGIQIAIWNAGKESVRSDNILSKAVTVRIAQGATILSAKVKRQTRGLVKFRCQQQSSESVACLWDILENDDGGLIEVIYAGPSGVVRVEGDIEGKVAIHSVPSSYQKVEPFRVYYSPPFRPRCFRGNRNHMAVERKEIP